MKQHNKGIDHKNGDVIVIGSGFVCGDLFFIIKISMARGVFVLWFYGTDKVARLNASHCL